jgi:hypothetical protein
MGNESSIPANPLRPNRPPISAAQGLQALNYAERIDGYLEQVKDSPINRMARQGQNYLPALHAPQRQVPFYNPSEPWPSGQVIWMDPTADAGLPHTRPPFYICMSRDFPEKDLAKTLLHERVHVSQRLHTAVWKRIFAETWDFKPWTGNLPADLESRRRLNPDLIWQPLYIWKDIWVPFSIFRSSSQPKLAEADTVWWDASTRTLHREAPPGWVEFFGNIPAGEHPFELAAYLVADAPQQNKAWLAIRSRLINELPRAEVI